MLPTPMLPTQMASYPNASHPDGFLPQCFHLRPQYILCSTSSSAFNKKDYDCFDCNGCGSGMLHARCSMLHDGRAAVMMALRRHASICCNLVRRNHVTTMALFRSTGGMTSEKHRSYLNQKESTSLNMHRTDPYSMSQSWRSCKLNNWQTSADVPTA